jgi:AcrR family transcriptional regulator
MSSINEAVAREESTGADRLLETARRLFLEYGYRNMSMQQIAEAAGMTKGAPYYHYENKTALFMAVSRQVIQSLRDSLLSPFMTDGTLGDHLRQGMSNALQTSSGVFSLWLSDFLSVTDLPLRSALLVEIIGVEAFSQILTPEFEKAAARGELLNVAPSAASRLFMKLLVMTMDEEGYLSRLGVMRDPDLETTIDELVRVFLYGVLCRAA